MKRKSNNDTLLICRGLGISRFINKCVDNNIEICNVIKCDSKTLEFNIDDSNYRKLKKIDLQEYTIEVKKVGGKRWLKQKLTYRCGLIIGLVLSIIAVFFVNNRLLNIQISGLSKYSEDEVITSINDYGLNYFSKMNSNFFDLENHLSKNFDFSLVSIISKGNTLIVNIKEELSDISDKYLPIVSDYNMVITEINVYAGTSNISKGDIVYLGDTLVYPYEIINNEKQSVVPRVEIKADLYYSVNYSFKNQEEVFERTGNKQILEMNYSLGRFNLISENKENEYSTYEIENIDKYISNYFLPIKVNKVIAYETKLVTKNHNFEEEKDIIVNNLKNELYSKIPNDMEIENEEIKISSTNYGNIVTIYAKSSVYLNYK